MRQATIIGSKSGKFESIAVGGAGDMREQYKKGSFQGYGQVYYLDTSGIVRRKKGAGEAKKPAPKAAKAEAKK